MSEPFLGEIRMVGFNFAPTGWALCAGQLLAISQNAALFSLLGTTYGGDGQTTFALPDLRSRVAMAAGTGNGLSPRIIGQVGGAETVTISSSQMPIHNHLIACNTGGGNQATPSGDFPAVESTGTSLNYATTSNGTMNAAMAGNAGGSQPTPTLPPYLCVNFIIAMQGIFPSRN